MNHEMHYSLIVYYPIVYLPCLLHETSFLKLLYTICTRHNLYREPRHNFACIPEITIALSVTNLTFQMFNR
jgi:hypothetical protein